MASLKRRGQCQKPLCDATFENAGFYWVLSARRG
jgi:hypothetical protein